jgi:hypothetical protein
VCYPRNDTEILGLLMCKILLVVEVWFPYMHLVGCHTQVVFLHLLGLATNCYSLVLVHLSFCGVGNWRNSRTWESGWMLIFYFKT